MIVQSAGASPEASDVHFIITQIDHARACGSLLDWYGNDEFQHPEAPDVLKYVLAHHDEGWRNVDELALIDARTGLPYHHTQTPMLLLLHTNSGSPDFNELQHPFAGLISSMHTYGLYHGRYGLSDRVFVDSIAPEFRQEVYAILNRELARQRRLKATLTAHTHTSWLAEEQHIQFAYKLLEFFDTLALFLQSNAPHQRGPMRFQRVPRTREEDITVLVRPADDDTVIMNPYPFSKPEVVLETRGRYLQPQEESDVTSAAGLLAAAPLKIQRVRIIPPTNERATSRRSTT